MEEVKALISDIRSGKLAPIYFLMGEEPYYIDRISEFITHNILTEEERGFNQTVLYGKDTTVDEIIGQAKRYPMMAEYQVVVVREAQHLSRTIEQLASYADQPQPTTVLVICFKYKTLDKRKKLIKTLRKGDAVVFESKKLYENQVSDWIRRVLLGSGYRISHKASALLVEYLGTDLSRISNELEKLKLVLPDGSEITPETIEDHIGISKDFNNFELKKAIADRDIPKATQIIKYFSQNPKENPFVLTVALLHTFFSQLLQYHGLSDHSPRNVASALRINPYFVGEYQTAARNYPMKSVSRIIGSLREMDLKGKGVGSSSLSHRDLLQELLYKIV
ncbi:DNA polymerase III subunit delta [Robiginitalea sp. SC105]|uniref:DNA polymerase III subunit delta n=1 Tax=Robiginitalea sp. SC105 TaxID=2762332 RepID=UPI00163AA84B|nr:DNA polymerase III subunit delta [Robiginitalea sp. SC105]MBC2840480.1 DNA polymerase III subunit delta [Robiginitalea sp. SC105]